MKSIFSLLVLLVLARTCLAENTELIPLEPPHEKPAASQPGNDSFARENADLCTNLRREMNSLKGKPLRRNAVAQRYDLECTQRRP